MNEFGGLLVILDDAFYAGLKALVESSFPKRCPACGRHYETSEAFLAETRAVSEGRSGLKQGQDDGGAVVVEAFRNCVCGSTLMDVFHDRRDTSHQGLERRAQFERSLTYLIRTGMKPRHARTELLKIMRGEASTLLNDVDLPMGKG